jgi:hypothetical protein
MTPARKTTPITVTMTPPGPGGPGPRVVVLGHATTIIVTITTTIIILSGHNDKRSQRRRRRVTCVICLFCACSLDAPLPSSVAAPSSPGEGGGPPGRT